MRDPGRKGKKRDLRRSLNNGGFSPWKYYQKVHPSKYYRWSYIDGGDCGCGCNSYEACRNNRIEFIHEWADICYYNVYGSDNAPAWYRRELNRKQRRREKSAVRKAFLKWDWDNFYLPRYRRNVNWLYW